jgi:2-haloacid dehalogenase
MNVKAIIYDLGAVLIDWNPEYLFKKIIHDEEKRKYFFEHICTAEWNEEQDGGRSLKEATELLVSKYPDWKEDIEAYYGRWEEMLGGSIPESVQVFKELKEKNKYKFYALTNWSAELFPIALNRYDFLHWFDGRVVSGEEKTRKPFPEFYQRLLDRYDLDAKETLFIDDNLRNVKAAEQLGIPSIHFKNAEQLRKELITRDVL